MTTIQPPPGMSDTPFPPAQEKSDLHRAGVEQLLASGPLDPAFVARWLAPDEVAAREERQRRQRERDWPELGRYEADNRLVAAGPAPLLVFMGDSFTELWGAADPALFSGDIVNRGIAGQTSPQMLLRFTADVVRLRPRFVHLVAGGNDIAGNTGPTGPEQFTDNIRAMADLAAAHGIGVVIGTLLPVGMFVWAPDVRPRPWIDRLNDWLRGFAAERGYRVVDYARAIPTEADAIRPDLSKDGAHLTRAGYALLRPLVVDLIADLGAR